MMFWGERTQHFFLSRISKALGLLLLAFTPALQADPWVNAGDAFTRHHLQFLHDQGRLPISLATWPISWAEIDRELRNISIAELNDAEAWSYQYLVHERDRAKRTITRDKRLLGSNSLRPYTSFGNISTREMSFVSGSTSIHSGNLAGKLQIDYVFDPLESDDQNIRAEGSYLAATAGNWVLGLGAIDRWWGPAWHSSLILSGNSRAPAGVFINRKEALPIELPLLRWAGQWNFSAFISQLEEDRPISKPIFAGARATTRPFDNLEIGVSRTGIVDGTANEELAPGLESPEASFQLFSYDARLSGFVSRFNASVYAQATEKRGDGTDSSSNAELLGVELAGLTMGVHSRVGFELEKISSLSDPTLYSDTAYPYGYSYRARSLAINNLGGDKKATLFGEHHFKGGQIFRWKVQNIENAILDGNTGATEQDQQYIEGEAAFPIGQKLLATIGIFSLKESMTFSDATIESGGYLELHFRF